MILFKLNFLHLIFMEYLFVFYWYVVNIQLSCIVFVTAVIQLESFGWILYSVKVKCKACSFIFYLYSKVAHVLHSAPVLATLLVVEQILSSISGIWKLRNLKKHLK